MSAVGLTKAMVSGLEYIRGDHERTPNEATYRRMHEAGLTTPGGGQLTPRGHAALAAPRMTASQLALLEFLSTRSSARVTGAQWNVACNLKDLGFVVVSLRYDRAYAAITHPGLKALNDVRAAMGSELYKRRRIVVTELIDTFRGDNQGLIASINALLHLDSTNSLVPHGIGGHARVLLASAAVRLAAPPAQAVSVQDAIERSKLIGADYTFDNAWSFCMVCRETGPVGSTWDTINHEALCPLASAPAAATREGKE